MDKNDWLKDGVAGGSRANASSSKESQVAITISSPTFCFTHVSDHLPGK